MVKAMSAAIWNNWSKGMQWILIGFLQGGTVIPLLMMANNQFCFFLLKKVAAFSLFSQLNLHLPHLTSQCTDSSKTQKEKKRKEKKRKGQEKTKRKRQKLSTRGMAMD
jgi:hypothetical protein